MKCDINKIQVVSIVLRCEPYIDMLNHLSVDHQCIRQTDIMAFSNSAVDDARA